MNYDSLAPVLQSLGLAEAAGDYLCPATVEQLAGETEMEVAAFRLACRFAHEAGLAYAPLERDPYRPTLMKAGRQYLFRRGAIDADALTFLPCTIDDLNARSALLRGGTLLADEFRHALLAGRAVEHAASLVPPAFAPAITQRIALDLFAAAVALMARLEAEEPPACIAEELLALKLVSYAESWLEVDSEDGTISRNEAIAARVELPALFGLFENGEAIALGQMREPADAAVALDAGVSDLRVEAWFRPFAGALPTGYLLADPR